MTTVGSVLDARDASFAAVFDHGAELGVLHEGMTWAEGPAFDAGTGVLYFSDVPREVIYRRVDGAVQVYRSPSGFANGNTIDASGALITCEQRGRRVTRTAVDGTRTVIADSYAGGRLNSPNDVVVHPDGSVWFSDPDYGIRGDDQGVAAPSEQEGCFVYRVEPGSGRIRVAANDLIMPNGLAFSPDAHTLYVADSAFSHDPQGPRHVRAYDVASGGRLTNSRVLVEIDEGWPDGVRVDDVGRLWVASGDGARCYAADGTHLGTVRLPEIAANLCFAELDGRPTLVVTATSRVYAIPLAVG